MHSAFVDTMSEMLTQHYVVGVFFLTTLNTVSCFKLSAEEKPCLTCCRSNTSINNEVSVCRLCVNSWIVWLGSEHYVDLVHKRKNTFAVVLL